MSLARSTLAALLLSALSTTPMALAAPSDPAIVGLPDDVRDLARGEGWTAPTAQASCGGIAPVQSSCGFRIYASAQIVTSPCGETFTGQQTIYIQGPLSSWRMYVVQCAAGVAYASSASGPGLYAGTLDISVTTQGAFGAAGSLGGAGTWRVTVTYN